MVVVERKVSGEGERRGEGEEGRVGREYMYNSER